MFNTNNNMPELHAALDCGLPPRAALVPATSAEEIISQRTPSNSCELGSIEPSLTDAENKVAVDEFLKLDAEVYTKADELAGEYQALMQRFNDELLPLCDRVQAFLSQRGTMHIPGLPSWTSWRDKFLRFLQKQMKMSLATFKRRLKEFRELDAPEESEGEETDEKGGEEEENKPVIYDSPKEQVTKWIDRQRKVLSGGDGPIDADPIRDNERRVDTSLQLLDEFQLALDDGFLDPAPQVVRLRHEINHHSSKLTPVPLHLRQANEFVVKWHKHHGPLRVAKFSIGAVKNGELVAVAICMRPASRHLDDGKTIEVARLATIRFADEKDDEEAKKARKNAGSFLYGRCARIATEMGYDKIMTYLLDDEPGMTVRGAGWTLEKRECGGTAQGLRKNRPNGHEITDITFKKKQRWALQVGNAKPVSSVPVEVAEDEANAA